MSSKYLLYYELGKNENINGEYLTNVRFANHILIIAESSDALQKKNDSKRWKFQGTRFEDEEQSNKNNVQF